MTLKKDNIVISCANGKKTFELVKILESVKKFNVFTTDLKNKKINTKNFFKNLGTNNKNYLKNLLENFEKYEIVKYIPLADEEVFIASKNIKKFKSKNIKVYCNNYKNILILNNKIKTLELLTKYKVPVPKWRQFRNFKEYKSSIDFFFDIDLDLVIKPIISRGNRNINYFYKKDYRKLIQKYSDFEKNFFINEKLYPKYYDIDLFSKKITTKNNQIIRQNLNPHHPTIYKGFRFVKNKDIENFSSIINKKFNNQFILDIDAMTDKNKKIKVIEINSRPSGAFVHSLKKTKKLKNEFLEYIKK